LLIACANVANLLLARASHRRRELRIKLALGASRWQAARESIVACVLLAIAGSALGSLLTAAIVRFVRSAPPGMLPRLSEIRLDAATLAFALTLSVLAGTAVAVFVSVRVIRRNAWKGMSGTGIDLSRSKPSPILVVAELASAIVLVAGAALLLTSFVRLTNRDLGFDASNALTMRLSLTPVTYRDESRQTTFSAQLVDALARMPAIEAAAAGTELPFQPTRLDFYPIVIGGRPVDSVPLATSVVTPGYFRALGIPILSGREFSTDDRPGAPLAAIVSQSFASRFFGAAGAVGQEIRVANAPPARVVGVAADTRRDPGITEPSSLPGVYFSAAQRAAGFNLVLAFRSGQDPRAVLPAVRQTVADLDPSLPIYSVATVARLLSERFAESRLYGMGSMALAGIALLLAAVGLYGVTAYSVASRTQEWGIRMALGADAVGILRHVFGGGLRLTAIGMAIGVAGSWWTSRFLRTLLFGISPNDPATLVWVTTLFLAVALIACYIPARRASRVDPMVALRHE
jgi:predicted permease